MRFSIAHLLAAMLIVALIAARLHSHETRDFITQVAFWLVLASLAVQIAYDKSRAWMIALWLGFGAYATWSGTLTADNAPLAIPLGCVLGVYLARRGLRQRQARP
jgi:4-amino-4-deoxy-L-arabinose transferase-like glycosyltransferase